MNNYLDLKFTLFPQDREANALPRLVEQIEEARHRIGSDQQTKVDLLWLCDACLFLLRRLHTADDEEWPR